MIKTIEHLDKNFEVISGAIHTDYFFSHKDMPWIGIKIQSDEIYWNTDVNNLVMNKRALYFFNSFDYINDL